MWDALKSALNGNLPNIFVLAGIVFLAIAIIGEFTGKFKADKAGRIGGAVGGTVLLICGILLNVPPSTKKAADTASLPTTPATPTPSPNPRKVPNPSPTPNRQTAASSTPTPASNATPGAADDNAEDLQKRIEATQASLLRVPDEYTKRYSELLRQANTGLVKLLPRGKYDNVMTLRGAGAYYSFVRRSQEYGYGSDIELEGGQFGVGFAGADYGFFMNLGDVPIQNVPNSSSPIPSWAASQREQWLQMWNYRPPQELAQLRGERNKFTHTVTVQQSMTYLLRSISPRYSDSLTAVRVEKINPDESVIISWHLLTSFTPPAATGPDAR
jgi:hypothetical protein